MPAASDHPALVWLDPEQVALARAVAERAGLHIIAAGSPQVGRSGEVAEALGAQPQNDLRNALTTSDAAIVILASPGDFAGGQRPGSTSSDADDAHVLRACRSRGVKVVSLEPMPSSLLQLDTPTLVSPIVEIGPEHHVPGHAAADPASTGNHGVAAAGDWATFCPLARLSRSAREATDLINQVGPLHTVVAECWAGLGRGSLGARLFDAMDAIVWLLGQPDQVDAAYVYPARGRPMHAMPGETLRGIEGHLTANLRFSDGLAAAIVASSRAGRWNRTLTLLGENGRLRIYDDGFVWIGNDGQTVDSSRTTERTRGTGADESTSTHAADAIADQITRLLDPRIPPEQPTDYLQVLASAGAALLSARTSEAESPATILRMARSG